MAWNTLTEVSIYDYAELIASIGMKFAWNHFGGWLSLNRTTDLMHIACPDFNRCSHPFLTSVLKDDPRQRSSSNDLSAIYTQDLVCSGSILFTQQVCRDFNRRTLFSEKARFRMTHLNVFYLLDLLIKASARCLHLQIWMFRNIISWPDSRFKNMTRPQATCMKEMFRI